MRKISLSVCVGLLLLLLIISGCGKFVPSHGGYDLSKPPADSESTLISIISDGETTFPYMRFSWGTSWTGKAWVAADALQLIYELPDIAPELPIVSYGDDFTVQYQEGASYSYMFVFDDSFEYLYHIASYSDMDYLSCLAQLPKGTYYVGIAVSKQGDYIEAGKGYESSGYDCVFKLVVNSKS